MEDFLAKKLDKNEKNSQSNLAAACATSQSGRNLAGFKAERNLIFFFKMHLQSGQQSGQELAGFGPHLFPSKFSFLFLLGITNGMYFSGVVMAKNVRLFMVEIKIYIK